MELEDIYIYIDPDRIFRSRYIGIGSRYIEINLYIYIYVPRIG